MNLVRTLILSGVVALGANAALANEAARTHDSARIQAGIYEAQRHDQRPVLREGRASAQEDVRVHAVPEAHEPYYFDQASAGSDPNAN
ncbi:hypothetical protein [Terrihabitans sp. B22-R8]|uniref:hypothetical protein n=1 Tax=Terrihabitans sp. B22-R8 TaxID=3425128 RepID=UPI00403CE625